MSSRALSTDVDKYQNKMARRRPNVDLDGSVNSTRRLKQVGFERPFGSMGESPSGRNDGKTKPWAERVDGQISCEAKQLWARIK